MIGKAIATALVGVLLCAPAAFGFGAGAGGGVGIGAPMETLMPSPPGDVRASAGKDMATVSFKPPKTDGGSPVTAYTVTAYPGPIMVRSVRSPIVVKGLMSGVNYRFTVVASNVIGTGLASAPSNVVTPQ